MPGKKTTSVGLSGELKSQCLVAYSNEIQKSANSNHENPSNTILNHFTKPNSVDNELQFVPKL